MFMAQSQAKTAPMNVPPGSPRQTAGGGMMGKGGGGQVFTPGGGGKGGGGRPARPRMFDNNPGQFGGPRGFGGPLQVTETPAFIQDALQSAGPVNAQAISPPSQQPVLNEYGLPAAVQPPTQPASIQNMIQQALNAGPGPMAPTPTPLPATNQYGLPMGMHPSQVPTLMANIPEGLMSKLQGFGGF